MRSLLEILASTITALRETPPPGEARCKHAEQTVAAGGGKEKRKNKALEKNIFVFCQKKFVNVQILPFLSQIPFSPQGDGLHGSWTQPV